jgi:hypothetical protein
MQNAEPVWDVRRDGGCARASLSRDDHWRARCRETGTAGSGRGPLEKDLLAGTSSAAYRYCGPDSAEISFNSCGANDPVHTVLSPRRLQAAGTEREPAHCQAQSGALLNPRL